MAVSHGSKAVLKVNDGTTLQDISAYVTETGLNRLRDMAETTPIGGTTAKTYIPGLRDATIPVEGNFDTAVDAILQDIYDNDDAAAFEFHPAGTATGTPVLSGSFLLASYEIGTGSGDKGTVSGELQVTGAVTRATNP